MPMDLRVQKTRANIEEHFLKLLKDYSFQDITVKMLIMECRINRSTFYRNYGDKYELIERIVQGVLGTFAQSLRPGFIVLPKPDERRLQPYFTPMLDFFTDTRTVLVTLKQRELPIDLFGDMHRTFSKKLLAELKNHYQLAEKDMSAASYFAGIISSNLLTAMQWWHEESPLSSQEDILKMITSTVIRGIYRSMENHFA